MIRRKNRGSIVFILALVILLFMVLVTFFTAIIFKNNVNLVLHNLKNDLYLISRNSIFSIEKDMMGEDIDLINYVDLKDYISSEIRTAWGLDRNLKNGTGIIKSAKIEKLTILEAGDTDPINNKQVKCLTVHLMLGVKVKPIILEKAFDDIFYFKFHEDIKLDKLDA